MSEVAIRVKDVHKSFKLPHEKQSSLKGALINMLRGKASRTYERQHVLKDVSFEVKSGEFFGIVGRNGSGKSTLLKLLAGIYVPDRGEVTVNGKLTPFIELGVGFSPELTGRENVFLNGALLGYNRKEIESMYDDIVEFAELSRFMDQKLKNYSSGMQVRLAFSIAVRAKTAILLIDEVLAVGDVKFQQKCFEYFYKLKREKRTIVFISHDMESVQKFCDRAVVLDAGKLLFDGKPAEAAVIYKELNFDGGKEPQVAQAVNDDRLKIKLTSTGGKQQKVFGSGETMRVSLEWKEDARAEYIGVAIHRGDGLYVFGTNNIGPQRFIKSGQCKATYEVELNVGAGDYYIEAAIFGMDESQKVYYTPRGPSFVVHNSKEWQGITELTHSWHDE